MRDSSRRTRRTGATCRARLGDDAYHLTTAAAGPRAIEAGAERPHGLEIEEFDRLTHALDHHPAQ
ncbi:MAG: hypothetical protein WCH75_13155, partial [Candidatus Binatia bacterium]